MYKGRLARRLGGLPRSTKRWLFVCFDGVALLVLVWASFSIRLGHLFSPSFSQSLLMLAAPAIAIPIFVRMGLYRSVLRYLPERAMWTILAAVTTAVLVWISLAFLTRMTGLEGIPGSVPVYYWVLSVVAIVGSRYGAKLLLFGKPVPLETAPRTLIYGTGEAAAQLATALTRTRERNVLGFIADDDALQGMDMLGLRIYPSSGLESVVGNFGIDEIISATPLPTGAAQRGFLARFGTLPVRLRILPPIVDLAAGKYSITNVRDIDIDDLLRRSPVPADPQMMRDVVEGRVILVTGAAGSIGSALSRTIAALKPAKLVLMDFNEHGLYQIGRELAKDAAFPIVRVLGSVIDGALATHIMCEHKVETVYHCAAFKHVSMVEANSLEGARNNILGTWTIAEAAHDCHVKNFILISSDKAVRPANIMGATKRWSELIVRHHAERDPLSGRNFASVRFGNVIGSSGSVVPLFKEQIAAGGPVTVTHKDMTRYFMSVQEAAELIIQATTLSASGDILLLEMGGPVRIKDLAEDMIMLAGYTVRNTENPEGDIEISIVGPAEGEKLHEELAYDPSAIAATLHPKILRAHGAAGRPIDLSSRIAAIRERIEARDEAGLRRMLFDFDAS